MAGESGMEKWYLYALKSLTDDNLYIGISRYPEKRLKEHNAGKTRSTKARGPFVIIHQEECESLKKARAKERYYKTTTGRRFLRRLKDKVSLFPGSSVGRAGGC